jgi:hypothetical protein
MRVAMRDDSYVPTLQFDRLESSIADERYPARTAGDDMILDHVLGAGRYLVGNATKCRDHPFGRCAYALRHCSAGRLKPLR